MQRNKISNVTSVVNSDTHFKNNLDAKNRYCKLRRCAVLARSITAAHLNDAIVSFVPHCSEYKITNT